mgnify:CR=1 FL=1
MSIEWYAVHTLVGQEEKAKAKARSSAKALSAVLCSALAWAR